MAGQGDQSAELATGRQVLDILAGQREQTSASGGLRLLSIDDRRVDLIHEALLRSRDGQPYWPTVVNYLTRHKDRDLLQQNLRHAAEVWAQAKPGRARRKLTASWGELRRWKPLRHAASAQDRAFLSASRLPALVKRNLWWTGIGVLTLPVTMNLAALASKMLNETTAVRDAFNWYRWVWRAERPPIPRTVEVALGRFVMGCMPGRDDVLGIVCEANEAPREVDLVNRPGACISYGIFEVTYDEYDYYVWSLRNVPQEIRPNYPETPDPWGVNRGTYPVVSVTAREAEDYAKWLSVISENNSARGTWRLPTEEEWEYVARAENPASSRGLPGPYWWGKISPAATASIEPRANCSDCDSMHENKIYPVGRFTPNSYGLHDTAGNVFEWTSSVYTPNNKPVAIVMEDYRYKMPRVARGGTYQLSNKYVRASIRYNFDPNTGVTDVGFRVCRTSSIDTLKNGAAER